MQTTKFLFVVGLGATLVAIALTSGARDTEEQRQAREALRQKMAELDASGASHPAPEAPPAPAAPAAPAAPPPAIAPVAALAPVSAAVPAATTARASMFGPVPEAVEDANTAQLRQALRQAMAALDSAPSDGPFAPVPPAVENANVAQLRQALRQAMAALGRGPTSIAPLAMETPLSPLSGSKSARLSQLLQRYNADQISPKEYHTQRAAIVAEP